MSAEANAYSGFIDSELKSERERRSSLDARGLAIVTTSGSLVTLLAGIGAFVSSDKDFHLPAQAATPLVMTLLGFVIAAFSGLLANANRRYAVADSSTLAEMRDSHWSDTSTESAKVVAMINSETIRTLRRGNNQKAFLATAGLVLELVALVMLAVTVTVVLTAA